MLVRVTLQLLARTLGELDEFFVALSTGACAEHVSESEPN
jgi:hypothetical protein